MKASERYQRFLEAGSLDVFTAVERRALVEDQQFWRSYFEHKYCVPDGTLEHMRSFALMDIPLGPRLIFSAC